MKSKESARPKHSPSYSSSPASEQDIPSQDPAGYGPVYFFHDPATAYLSQWYLLNFTAPLPTRESITDGSKSTAKLVEELRQADQSTWHTFDCNEQYMMYAKAVCFGDDATAKEVLLTKGNPRKCKGLGRSVQGFESTEWDKYREAIVEEGNWWKFTNGASKDGEQIRELLLATGDRELVEASPYDRIWGIGFAAKFADKSRPKWGSNLLGKAIARVRGRMREMEEMEHTADRGDRADKTYVRVEPSMC